jgi:DNA repair protein RadC
MTIKALQYADLITACASYVREAKPEIKEPSSVYRLMAPLFLHAQQESIFVLLLDTKSRIIGAPRETTRGLIDSCPTHPREIFRLAITEGAAAVVVVHNHPTGDPTPSREDIEATRRLVEAGRIIGIPIFDHVIIGNNMQNNAGAFCSLREQNLCSFTSTLNQSKF